MSADLTHSDDVLQAGLPPANDRMLTTCFLAALLHGIVILGVTFSAQRPDIDASEAQPLEVVLVNDQAPKAASNPNARYVSQRNQIGSGNTLKNERTLIPTSSTVSIDRPGAPGGEGNAAQRSGTEVGEDTLIASLAPSVKILYFASPTAAREATELPQLLEKKPELSMAANDDGVELHLRGEARQQLWVAADTRESDVAAYLDGWRRKIERVGTLNFPDVARRRKLSGTPVIEVTIGADGRLLATRIRRSSGHAELDDAAMRILKVAAPYDAFPGDLGSRHDEIRIAYEWQFLGGAAQGASVYVATP